MDITPSLLNAIFGEESHGETPEARAATSSRRFVRGIDELSVDRPKATGTTYTAQEALDLFGLERLIEIIDDGSAILTQDRNEPAATLKQRRLNLALSERLVAKRAGVSLTEVIDAENPKVRSHIRTLNKIARILGLDERKLSQSVGAGGDSNLGVRLKSWRETENGLSPRSVIAFTEAAWVIQTQERLRRCLEPAYRRPTLFQADDDYNYPVFVSADRLARKTRLALDYAENTPIVSLRELCHRLRVPLLHVELDKWIAGATIETNHIRGIIVNTQGANRNVLVQRATVAHELGHLLWDPPQQLNSLLVDRYFQFDRWERRENDPVEARANAFAVELLSPKAALQERFGALPVSGDTLRLAMDEFGLSRSAMSWHLYNATDRQHHFPTQDVDTEPTDEWRGREQYTADYFPLPTTPPSRRGSFCAYVVKAQRENWLTERTAADYLMTDEDTYRAKSQEILDLFPGV